LESGEAPVSAVEKCAREKRLESDENLTNILGIYEEKMKYHKILFFICLALTVIIASYGFYRIDSLPGIIAALIGGSFWVVLHKKIPYACLTLSIVIAVAGLILGVPKIFVLVYSLVSIAVWDIALMDLNISKNSPDQKPASYRKRRLALLAIVLTAGLLTSALSMILNLNIHFVFMILFICLSFFFMERLISILRKL
jgi:hypothetical protein